jgi:hypothetical protein
MNILMSFHAPAGVKVGEWSTPIGLAKSFVKKGHKVDLFTVKDANNFSFDEIINTPIHYDLLFFCWAGPSVTFDRELLRVKQNTKSKVFLELGDDEPLGFRNVVNRIQIPDAIFPPDLRCHKKYISMGLNSHWLPCWCDDEIFYKKDNPERKNICVTTCGNRQYTNELQVLFGDRFVNKRLFGYDNTDFYNSGTIAYQFARYDEITRRLFEIGGCGNAVLTNKISSDTGIFDLFKDDEDIAYFSSAEECFDKMNKLLNDETYRKKLTTNMYNKITKHHLVGNRVDQILQVFSKS